MKAARHLVSQRKRRTVDATVPCGSVDLDLTEIHPGIVCMGYPASGVEALYRNSYDDVLRYLDHRYGDAYVVYNLCGEAAYQYSADKFHGRVRCFPFLDHAAAPLRLMPAFVKDAATCIARHPGGTAVIHCKAGKGRTGVLACCLLLALEPAFSRSAEAVMRYYGAKRTRDGKGLTVPSQRRSVAYYARLLSEYGGEVPAAVPVVDLACIRIVGLPRRWSPHALKLYIGGEKAPQVVVRLRDAEAGQRVGVTETRRRVAGGAEEVTVLTLACDAEPRFHQLVGDLRFEFCGSGGGLLGVLSIHSLFMEASYGGGSVDRLAKVCDDERCCIEFDYTVAGSAGGV
ncbi:Tyrosine phosphatase family [Novymonas esmeraldas]|uniref:phosphatidylinositol-3,4,5-trisphosphate 3-phosphatase n=1 Tax=Novymonas esmeraldas TaxID=1808958 RepID=A0AAW0EMB8_9TRYP